MNMRPNIIFILADDMGYGDIGRQNPESAFPTPNIDALIDEGLRFTDAHTSSSVCTSSRYSILTERYCWRTYLKKGVISGEDSISLLPSFDGNQVKTERRKALIHHSIHGMFAIRSGKWKLCCCPGSGGWSSPKDGEARQYQMPELQLYDIAVDPSVKTKYHK